MIPAKGTNQKLGSITLGEIEVKKLEYARLNKSENTINHGTRQLVDVLLDLNRFRVVALQF